MNRIVVGLDPSAGDSKASGICLMDECGSLLHVGKWYKFSEITDHLDTVAGRVMLIAIDGPLQPPHELNRCCFSASNETCDHRQSTPYKGRSAEHQLNKRGYRCFATSKNSFARHWFRRCFALNDYLTAKSFHTLEVFPHATRKILFPELQGKKQSPAFRMELQSSLVSRNVFLPITDRLYSHDELDAVLAALTGVMHTRNQTEKLGDEKDGYIVIPRADNGT